MGNSLNGKGIKKLNKKQWICLGIVSAAILVFLSMFVVGILPQSRQLKPVLVNTATPRSDLEVLNADEVISQSFTLEDCGIKQVALWINTTNLKEDVELDLELFNTETDESIATWEEIVSAEHGDTWYPFELEEIYAVNAETKLQLNIRAGGTEESGTLAFKSSDRDSYAFGSLSINGVEQDRDIVFWLYEGSAGFINYMYLAMAAVVLIGVCVLLYWYLKQKNIEEYKMFLLLGALLGSLYLVLWSPYAAPDECKHIATAYRYSNVLMGEEPYSENGKVMMRAEDLNFNNQEEFTRLSTYALIWDDAFEQSQSNEMVASNEKGLSMSWIAYGPAILGITLARVLNLSSAGLMLMGRLFSLLYFLLTGAICLKLLPIGKRAMMCILLFPGIVEIGASFSYDNILNGMFFVYFSYLLHLWYEKKKINWKNIVILSAILCIGAPIKVIYVLLGLLAFLLVDNIKDIKKIIYCAIPLVASCVVTVLQRMFAIQRLTDGGVATSKGIDNGWSLVKIIHNPVKYVQLVVYTVVDYAERWIKEVVWGFPEYSGIDFPDIVPWLFIIVLIIALFGTYEKYHLNIKTKLLTLIILAGLIAAMSVAFMLDGFATMDSDVIGGIQGRYFIPLVPWMVFSLRDKDNASGALKKYYAWVPMMMLGLNALCLIWVFITVIRR